MIETLLLIHFSCVSSSCLGRQAHHVLLQRLLPDWMRFESSTKRLARPDSEPGRDSPSPNMHSRAHAADATVTLHIAPKNLQPYCSRSRCSRRPVSILQPLARGRRGGPLGHRHWPARPGPERHQPLAGCLHNSPPPPGVPREVLQYLSISILYRYSRITPGLLQY